MCLFDHCNGWRIDFLILLVQNCWIQKLKMHPFNHLSDGSSCLWSVLTKEITNYVLIPWCRKHYQVSSFRSAFHLRLHHLRFCFRLMIHWLTRSIKSNKTRLASATSTSTSKYGYHPNEYIKWWTRNKQRYESKYHRLCWILRHSKIRTEEIMIFTAMLAAFLSCNPDPSPYKMPCVRTERMCQQFASTTYGMLYGYLGSGTVLTYLFFELLLLFLLISACRAHHHLYINGIPFDVSNNPSASNDSGVASRDGEGRETSESRRWVRV